MAKAVKRVVPGTLPFPRFAPSRLRPVAPTPHPTAHQSFCLPSLPTPLTAPATRPGGFSIQCQPAEPSRAEPGL